MANSKTGTNTSNTSEREYQVFLSFRWPDTYRGFTSSLHHALVDAGINAFIDDEDLQSDEGIRGNLEQVINDSKLYIPIFSKNYASSCWCLHELAQMVENIKEVGKEKVILPIFYDVTPYDVKLKTETYEDAILNLKQNTDVVAKWRQALVEVGHIKGWEQKKHGGDGNLINLVVDEVVALMTRQRPVANDLIGMRDQLASIYKLLDIESKDVRVIGIYGMSGIGKTTLTKTIYEKLRYRFGENCSFLEDVGGKAKKPGLHELRKDLMSNLCHSGATSKVGNVDREVNRIEDIIYNKKVLIVLDDVDEGSQFEKLIGLKFYSGSRILVTSRDKSILQRIRGLVYEVEAYYMKGLSREDALELFRKHAFRHSTPPEDYYRLSKDIVSTTCGFPLAVELIGSSLFGKNKEVWEERLQYLRKKSDEKVLDKLQISFQALEKDEQEIFLDIACFFVGQDKTNPMYVWKDCGFSPNEAIEVLTRRFMIKVVDNKFWMHNLLRDLGRRTAEANGRIPRRFWVKDDIIRELKSTETKGNVQAVRLATTSDERPVTVTPEQIGRFPHLQFLWFYEVICQGDFTGCLSGLKWISLQHSYSIPPPPATGGQSSMVTGSLHLEDVVVVNLAGLDFEESFLKSIITVARKLKVLTVSYNTMIHGRLTFPQSSTIEKLAFSDFLYLTKLDRSIENLEVLTDLSFERCFQLQKLPRQIGRLRNLQHLSLKNCDLIELPDSVLKLKLLRKLDVPRTAITRLPDNICELSNLSSVDASFTSIENLPSTISELSKLQTLRLDHCDRIQELPKLPRSLTTLRLSSNSLLTVPNLSDLPGLVELALSDGSQSMARSDTTETCDLQWIGSLSKLEKLYFCFSNVYAPTTELCSLSLLKELILHGVDVPAFEQLPSNLEIVELYDTRGKQVRLNKLPPSEKHTELVSSTSTEVWNNKLLRHIELQFIQERDWSEEIVRLREEPGCNELQAPELIGHWRGAFNFPSSLGMLQKFVLWGCPEVQDIEFNSPSEFLSVVSVGGCTSLERLGGLSNLKNLMQLTLKWCPSLQVVEGIAELELLRSLKIEGCRSMPRIFYASSSEMKIPDECQVSITCSGEIPDSDPAAHSVTWRSYILAMDSDSETTDSETETEDPPQNTNQENEEEETESATRGVYRVMVHFNDHEEEIRKRSWDYKRWREQENPELFLKAKKFSELKNKRRR